MTPQPPLPWYHIFNQRLLYLCGKLYDPTVVATRWDVQIEHAKNTEKNPKLTADDIFHKHVLNQVSDLVKLLQRTD